MNRAIEYMKSDPEFSQIYDRSIELDRLRELGETSNDIEALNKYAKALAEHSTRTVQYLMKWFNEHNKKLCKVAEDAQKMCTKYKKERDDMICLFAETIETTPEELYQTYIDLQGEVEPETAQKVTRHLKLIK